MTNKNFEESNNELWISNFAFVVDMSNHLNSLNKRFQAKDKLIAEMYENIRIFKLKLRM